MISEEVLDQLSTQELLDCLTQFQHRHKEMKMLVDDQKQRQEILIQQRDFL